MQSELKSFIVRKIHDIQIRRRGFTDYLNIPFDGHKPMPSSGNIVLRKCCEALESIGVKYQVTDGTALGFYREGGFIPYDTDLDIDILANGVDIKAIQELFENKLHMTIGRKMSYKGKIQQLAYYDVNEVIFDMIFWYQNGENCYMRYPESPLCILKTKYFENSYMYEFEGKKYPLHAPIEEWLVDRYGKDWKIPKKYEGDWRDDCHFFIK